MFRFKTLLLAGITFASIAATPAFAADKTDRVRVIYTFCRHSGCPDGSGPEPSLTLDAAGNLYGAARGGGNLGCGTYGCGLAFELTPGTNGKWTETVLHEFGPNGSGGARGPSSLAFDSAGNLYGAFEFAGGYCDQDGDSGEVFKLTPKERGRWSLKILFAFAGTLGCGPVGGLVIDSAGNLYGATISGGYGTCDELGDPCGTVFEGSPGENGQWTVTFPFAFDKTDGAQPVGALLFDAAGNLYGSSGGGGPVNGYCLEPYLACGTIFRLNPKADGKWRLTNLHYFGDGFRGSQPNGYLIFDSEGNLYGTTYSGGTDQSCTTFYVGPGCGTAFELIHDAEGHWTEKVLHDFKNDGKDGYHPNGGLVIDKSGNIYGTTSQGGAGNCDWGGEPGCGTVFKLTHGADGEWTETVLHRFGNSPNDGALPFAGLVSDANGNMYGTTVEGGEPNQGTVFQITP